MATAMNAELLTTPIAYPEPNRPNWKACAMVPSPQTTNDAE